MSTAPGSRSTAATRARTARRPAVPGRRAMLGGVAMVVLGSFMPWIDTALGQVSGVRGAGLWTFYAAMLGLAAALVPIRTLALAQGALFALAATVLPVWQVVHLVNLVGMDGWRPGPGLVLVFGGGIVAASAVRSMARARPPVRP